MAAPLTSSASRSGDDGALRAAKAALRREATQRRAAWTGDRARAAQRAAENFLRSVPRAAGVVVSGYVAMKDELEPLPLLRALASAGHPIALPVAVGRGQALLFRRWREGDALVAGPMGTRHPTESAETVSPALLIVPMLAFDQAGRRLGFGAGYYDRTLLKLRAAGRIVAAGFAFAAQRVAEAPAGPDDQKLDWIVTEEGAEAVA